MCLTRPGWTQSGRWTTINGAQSCVYAAVAVAGTESAGRPAASLPEGGYPPRGTSPEILVTVRTIPFSNTRRQPPVIAHPLRLLGKKPQNRTSFGLGFTPYCHFDQTSRNRWRIPIAFECTSFQKRRISKNQFFSAFIYFVHARAAGRAREWPINGTNGTVPCRNENASDRSKVAGKWSQEAFGIIEE